MKSSEIGESLVIRLLLSLLATLGSLLLSSLSSPREWSSVSSSLEKEEIELHKRGRRRRRMESFESGESLVI